MSEMIVWGGLGGPRGDTNFNTGGRYDPTDDTWVPTSTIGAPSARQLHASIWTGGEMIVWGGWTSGVAPLNTGGRYNPLADSWTPTSTVNAPSGRLFHTGVWTGSLMVIWGGTGTPTYLNTGGRYDPGTDSWTPTSTAGAPAGRYRHTAVWTGKEMIVWGGATTAGFTNTGARYNPAMEAWIPTSTLGAPFFGSFPHTAVWTGSFMIVWGSSYGGRYALGLSVDDDLDGLSECAGDCNDANPDVWSPPAEVAGLGVTAASPLRLAWEDQGAMAGPETLYDLVSGVLMTSFDGPDFAAGICLQSATAASYADVRPDPSPGAGFWYLVRARNSCGSGTYGTPERDASITACP